MQKGKKKNETKQRECKTTAERTEGRGEIKQITIPEVLTIKELADQMKIRRP